MTDPSHPPVPDAGLDGLALRLVEMGVGHQALPALESAVDLLLAHTPGMESFDLQELIATLFELGRADVARWTTEAAEYLSLHGAPRTAAPLAPAVEVGAVEVRQVAEGVFERLPGGDPAGIPRYAYRGEPRYPAVLCSLGNGAEHGAMLRITAPTLGYYGARHGMDVVALVDARFAPDRPPAWDKVVLLRSLLESYETVVWVDADAVICNPCRDIRRDAGPSRPMYLASHHYEGREVPNTGVWVLNRSPDALDLLEALWREVEFVDHPWWEQAALLECIGYEARDLSCRAFGPTPFTPLVGFLGNEWNSIRQASAPEPYIYHFAGEPVATRMTGMQIRFGEFLARVLDPGPGEAHGSGALEPERPADDPVVAVLRREHLPALLNLRGLTGTGVEVGVQQGLFSELILQRWRGRELISVDPWRAEDPDDYLDIANVSQHVHEAYYQETLARLSTFGARSRIWRATSVEASRRVVDGSLDFAYLDARHDRDSVLEDLTCWFPKVKPGGVLAGHDYLDGVLPEGDFGVKAAVDEFFEARGIPVRSTLRDGPWYSWIVEIPERACIPSPEPEGRACA